MKLLLPLIISLLSLNSFAGNDRFTYLDQTFVKHSENFKYKCDIDLDFLIMTVWIDTDLKDAPYSRLVVKSASVVLDMIEGKTGQRVIGREALVLSTQTARSLSLDTIIIEGDYYYGEEAPKKSSTYRIYENTDNTISVDYDLYRYDNNNNAVKEVSFTGACELNEVY